MSILIFIQLSNTFYYCDSSTGSECSSFSTSQDAGCDAPGMFQGDSKDNSGSITVMCPWRLFSTIKTWSIIILGFFLVNWGLYRVLTKRRSFMLPMAIILGLVSILLIASGIMDAIELIQKSCDFTVSETYTLNRECERFLFYVNIGFEVICGALMILSCVRINNWRVMQVDQEGSASLLVENQ